VEHCVVPAGQLVDARAQPTAGGAAMMLGTSRPRYPARMAVDSGEEDVSDFQLKNLTQAVYVVFDQVVLVLVRNCRSFELLCLHEALI